MSNLELIGRLCAVTTKLADIVREQALYIEQHHTVDDEAARLLEEKRIAADEELDLIEIELRPIHGTGAAERRIE